MAGRCYWATVVAIFLNVCFQTGDSTVHNVTVPEPPPGVDTVCDTPECISSAAAMLEKMNLSIDPCEDFNEFACGRFIEEYVIPNGKTLISTLNILDDANKVDLRDMLLSDNNSTEQGYFSKIQRFYRSCYNEEQVEAVGLTQYFNDSEFSDDWPTLNPSWRESDYNLAELLARYLNVSIDPLIGITVSYDFVDISKYALYLHAGSFGMDDQYYNRPRNDSILLAYERYLVETAVALNASRVVAERDAIGVVDLEIELCNIKASGGNWQFSPVRLGLLSRLYPTMNIGRAIRAAFDTVDISLPDDERVFVLTPTYIRDIASVLECRSKRTIQNLFGFRYALSRVQSLTRRMREIRLDFDRVLEPSTPEGERWLDCFYKTSEVFWQGLSKHFVTTRFSETAKRYVNEMIDNIKEEMKKMIEEATWVNESTKNEAIIKLAATKRKTGYQDDEFEEEDIERIYENLTMIEGNYYSNRFLGNILIRKGILASLRKPVNRDKWDNPPYDVNAYYSTDNNELVFHAGFMQAPYFSETFQDYINYGAVGTVIGHELTHGFDSKGMMRDASGMQRLWWAEEDIGNFVNRSQCIVDQYFNYFIDEIFVTVDGLYTQSQNEADIVGLKQAFRAYKQRVLRHGLQPRLPDLNLTQDQVFFLSFAQLYCEKTTLWGLISQLTSEYPPGKYRIIGTLQNSEDFARAYNCTPGSFMNPERKCGVW